MCLGVPGRVLEVNGQIAQVDFFGIRRETRLDIVDEPVAPGDYVLNHVGFAIRRIPARRSARRWRCTRAAAREADEDMMAADVRGEIDATRAPSATTPREAPVPDATAAAPARRKGADELKFRDPVRARDLAARHRAHVRPDRPRPGVGHARVRQPRAGDRQLRAARRPSRAALDVIMGPGCPVCVTDLPEVDEAVALARRTACASRPTATCCACRARRGRWPTRRPRARTSTWSTARHRRSSWRRDTDEPVVFFATGFETTAVATAAVLARRSAARTSRCSRRTSTSRR